MLDLSRDTGCPVRESDRVGSGWVVGGKDGLECAGMRWVRLRRVGLSCVGSRLGYMVPGSSWRGWVCNRGRGG